MNHLRPKGLYFSSKNKYLKTEAEDGGVLAKLLTHTPTVGKHVGLWPSLRNSLHMLNWTLEHNHSSNRPFQMWFLQCPNQRQSNIASTLSCLGRQILQGETSWEGALEIEGEYHHAQGYWDWAEDKNTLLTSVGELSTSLWDLHVIGGLHIRGLPYEEVVPEAKELTSVDEKKERFIP
ncbi:unnamed protein product [Withania somnifera]